MATTEIPKALAVEPDVLGSVLPERQQPRSGISFRVLQHWWMAFAASSVSVVSGHLLIKAGLNALVPLPAGAALVSRVLHQLLQPQVFAGLLIYMAGTIFWMKAVSQKEISFLYPLSSVNYVLVAAISVAMFHEAISVRRTAGVMVIVFGMILMTRQSGRKTS